MKIIFLWMVFVLLFTCCLQGQKSPAPTLTVVSIASSNTSPERAKVGDLVSLSFTASKSINTPSVTIATKPTVVTAGSSNSYTATYTMVGSDASGVVPFTIDFSSKSGADGIEVTTTTNGSSVTFDKTQPAVSGINRQTPLTETTEASTVTFRTIFSEPVSGVNAAGFTLTTVSGTTTGVLGNVTSVGGGGTTYDVQVNSIAGNGVIRLDLKASGTGITDAAGNAISGGFTTGQTYTINQVQTTPTLTTVSIASSNATPAQAKVGDLVSLSFTASEAINTPSVAIATKPANVVGGGGNSYTATYTMVSSDASGVVPFTIDFSSKSGADGIEVTTTTNGSSVTFDKTQPAVSGINRQTPLTETTEASTVTFRTIFSEPVSGVNAAGFTLTTVSGTTTGVLGNVTSVGGGGTTYDVQVNSIAGNGVIRLDLKASGTGITDAAGNAISGGFTTGQTYTINQVQTTPTLTTVSIASSNATPAQAKVGDLVSLSFTASEAINTPSVAIATKPANVVGGGGNSYTATYTMVSSDASGVVPFTINFSSTAGVAGSQVTTTTNGSSVTFDKTQPAVSGINRQTPLTETTEASTVTFRTIFSEPVSGVNAAGFTLTTISGTTTGVLGNVTSVGGGGTTYDVQVNSIAGNGVIRLDLKASGTGITDAAGNAISGGFTTGQTYTINQTVTQPGFASITQLSQVQVINQTKDKPQAKTWYYANQWWSVLSAVGGTKIFRLDGTTWTETLLLNTTGSKPDCWVSGDLVHLLLYKGSKSLLYSVQFDVATNAYKLWTQRPTPLRIDFPSGSETATLVVDGNARLWTATAGTTEVSVWYSDAPYTAWSSPITLASGVNDDDICAITNIPSQNKIGVLWSNQTTKRYGFRTHTDGASPGSWSADEVPASQSALDVGKGMADDHLSIVVASDGTLYCAAKTGYDKSSYPELILLVRRPSGIWDDAYTVTTEGTQAILILNEASSKVKVVYTTTTGGGEIVYRESSTANIAFGSTTTLISMPNILLNYASSTHYTYNPDVVIFATDETSSPFRAVSVLASDAFNSRGFLAKQKVVETQSIQKERSETLLKAYPNPFNSRTTVNFTLPYSADYTLTMYDTKGTQVLLKKGSADIGIKNQVNIDGALLPNGLYLLNLQTYKGRHAIKILIRK